MLEKVQNNLNLSFLKTFQIFNFKDHSLELTNVSDIETPTIIARLASAKKQFGGKFC